MFSIRTSSKLQEKSEMDTEDQNKVASDSAGFTLPKHIPFPPDVATNSEIINELFMLLFVLFSAGMQFLHIYRTVWWLPDSYINHTINFYLIDPFLVIFIVVIVSRKFLFCLLCKSLEIGYKDRIIETIKSTIKYTFANLMALILGWCTINIFLTQNFLTLFLLLYPFIVYTVIFGFRVAPFFRATSETESSYLNGIPTHCCSTNPSTVRDEIEVLKNDFNSRFKQVIFTSVINAYFGGFVPCFFAQNFLYYDVIWATQHIIFVWLGGFTMCTVFYFPARYCDVLHRSALHLGRWSRIDGRLASNQPPTPWSKSVPWAGGSVVKHGGEWFKAMGPVTTATPGNSSHVRFHKLFVDPSVLYMVLSGIQTFLVFMQLMRLTFTIEWHNILSLSFLTLTNHHTLFKVSRDYLVTQKIYAAESSIYEKIGSHFSGN